MTTTRLVLRGLQYYWPIHLAAVLGVAVAVSVLGGALVVGESVQASLRRLALARLGQTDTVVLGASFFREALAADLSAQPGWTTAWTAAVPLVVLEGTIEGETGGRRATRARVYGVDDRFWRFHGLDRHVATLRGREALLSAAMATDLAASAGTGVVLSVPQPSAIPAGVLQGRREGRTRTIRLTVREMLPASRQGEFSLRPEQGEVRAVFVPLELLQHALGLRGQANAVLLARDTASHRPARPAGAVADDALAAALRGAADIGEAGLRLRSLDSPRVVVIESDSGVMSDALLQQVHAALGDAHIDADVTPVLTYLANTIAIGNRTIPYSLVSAVDRPGNAGNPGPDNRRPPADMSAARPPIWLNEWAAADLRARPGDRVTLDYHIWSDDGGLLTRSAEFVYAGVVPMTGAGGDRSLTPDYPGLTGEARMADWDPPFPVDLGRVRPRDEDYWRRYRTAPKAFVPLGDGQRIWASRYGRVTSIRLTPRDGVEPADLRDRVHAHLRAGLDPVALGTLAVVPVRDDHVRAASGTTDFGQYFVYFSIFLVVSGLLLSGLFFRLGLEQRLREIGVLRAVGFPEGRIRRLFVAEGLAIAVAGSLLGAMGAVAYAAAIVHGLRTWWSGAVGMSSLEVSASPSAVAAGVLAAVAVVPIVVAASLRQFVRASPRRLISGLMPATARDDRRQPGLLADHFKLGALAATASAVVVAAATVGWLGHVGGFFSAGGLLLLASLLVLSGRLGVPAGAPISGAGWWPIARLGARGAAFRPGRTVLSVALIAFATFVIVAVGAFRRGAPEAPADRASGTGGYLLMAESLLPVHHDLGSPDGRLALDLTSGADAALAEVTISRFRLRAGDDGSCLNLYRPTRPRVLGAPASFIAEGRFSFSSSLAATPEERRNPWLLLERRFDDGAIPAIGDANSLAYVFHLRVGEDFVLPRNAAAPVRLRLVAALTDSVLQSELIVAEERFREVFPTEEGFRAFLIDTRGASPAVVAKALETGLAAYGLDVEATTDRLAAFHRVENTYLSTFQALGALGLLLGTLGVGIVLFRNVIERRRELAVMRAVGFGERHVTLLVVTESALLVTLGSVTGAACAIVAVTPALVERGDLVPGGGLVPLLAAVVAAGLASSMVAAAAARRFALVASLRAE
jgi:putative ABC transport system permease protein